MSDGRFQSPNGEYEPLYDPLKRRVSELVGQIEALAVRVAHLEALVAERARQLGAASLEATELTEAGETDWQSADMPDTTEE